MTGVAIAAASFVAYLGFGVLVGKICGSADATRESAAVPVTEGAE